MKTESFYRDVEFKVEVETNINASSELPSCNFNSTKREISQVKITGNNIEKALLCFSEACGYKLTVNQMLEIVCKNAHLIEWVSSGSFDSSTRNLFCDCFEEHLVGRTNDPATKEHKEKLAAIAIEYGYEKCY